MKQIPQEILLTILSYLTSSDLLKTAQVCKLWSKLASSEGIWRKLIIDQTSSNYGSAKENYRFQPFSRKSFEIFPDDIFYIVGSLVQLYHSEPILRKYYDHSYHNYDNFSKYNIKRFSIYEHSRGIAYINYKQVKRTTFSREELLQSFADVPNGLVKLFANKMDAWNYATTLCELGQINGSRELVTVARPPIFQVNIKQCVKFTKAPQMKLSYVEIEKSNIIPKFASIDKNLQVQFNILQEKTLFHSVPSMCALI